MRTLVRLCYLPLYYVSWGVFALVALGLNLGCLCLRPFPHTPRRLQQVRTVIRILFDLWVRWLHLTGIVRIRWRGFTAPLPVGVVYIANHPTLIDATLLLARLPDAVCIFKPALMRNPAIGTAAVMAGYVAGDRGLDLVREVVAKIVAGQSLLIFPEGTRTAPGTRLGPFKPGFAVMAARAQVPVQMIVIRASTDLLPRGRAWWRPPAQLPGEIEVRLDRRWPHDPDRALPAFSAEVERYLDDQLREPAP